MIWYHMLQIVPEYLMYVFRLYKFMMHMNDNFRLTMNLQHITAGFQMPPVLVGAIAANLLQYY